MTYGVYVHVPFCLRRCGYCDFNTYTASDLGAGATRTGYAAQAIAEMRLVRQWQLAHGIVHPAVDTVFFGGGTPTILPAQDLGAMLAVIDETWGLSPGAEVTTEANPDTVDARYVDALARYGFTRISFGMQSALPHVLRTLDRTHTPDNVARGVEAAGHAGLRSSVDLIYGAPGESMEDWRTSVRTAIDLGVDHVSAYALTVEPATTMGRRIAAGVLKRPDDDDEAAKYEMADAMFEEAGLRWYEISNWARPGHESRHNLGYWHDVDWAGIGPGAHSHYAAVHTGPTCRDEGDSAVCQVPHGGDLSWESRESSIDPRDSSGVRREAGNAGRGEAARGVAACGNAACGARVGADDPRGETVCGGASCDGGAQDGASCGGAGQVDALTHDGAACAATPDGDRPGNGMPDCTRPYGMRGWDVAHPRWWLRCLREGRVPWAGAERIGRREHMEEAIMLGVRLREGLDLSLMDSLSGGRFGMDDARALADGGLVFLRDGRMVPTLRGRLLNDRIVERLVAFCDG